jgi:uncharacterized phage-associated protein
VDVAAYIAAKEGNVEAVKLQMLLFYSQAWHLVAMDEPLFDDAIRAFEHGPLVRSVWEKHRGLRSVTMRHLRDGDQAALSGAEREVVDAVIAAYGHFDSWKLSLDPPTNRVGAGC